MRLGILLGLVALACGGAAEQRADDGSGPIAIGGTAGLGLTAGGSSAARGGDKAESGSATGGASGAAAATSGGSPATAGAPSGGAAAGHGGVATAGTSDSGGTSGAAAGDAGAGGESGAPPAPDDTGCLERPWSGNQADLSEKLPGLDCSSCSNGSELGYTVPSFCAPSRTCSEVIDLTTLPDDFLLLLPPGSAQKGTCQPQNCEGADGDPADLEGFTLQLLLKPLAGDHPSIKIETDENRRVLKRETPLIKCAEASSCYAYGAGAQFVVVVKPGAPRGWVRITVGTGAVCE